ncbi:sulfite exporter TauE/SafE family protein [Vibrio diabolicus]|uniref:sulfite exporter TauE/SafE family protein n=1 Tax=Vibrio TaxID=662 RepID=UPI0009414EC9|nr:MULTISPECIES: sulfite exporter TauE/SafE family protein [Vibrio]AVF92336.1 sulfite exporter TauE/SafE family protein [Vibrio diabolicus]MCE3218224.1 sulfite exporter TauE/SafE family protein [Vibrio diabolicus]MCR9553284.1 sulfite exporter TauE/SafE family protein [Vibrio sp. RM-41-2A]MCR9558223.1 sulfite exporter TauE/SafE family protein [Vibrio sp. RM-41-2B]MCR9624269.1 sulfite exporter TauE/SafE family protein [Vibrio sp. RM-44-3]
MNEPIFIIYYITAGLGIGFLAGLVGVGGGGMAVPIFAFLFSLQGIADTEVVHLALGTSMASMIITTLGSMRAHYKKENVDSTMVVKMLSGVLVGTFCATFVASYLQGIYLAGFFSVFMLYVAYKMFLNTENEYNPNPHGAIGNITVGSVIGSVSALVSISGAGLIIPYLVQQNFEVKRAIGTSAAIGFPIALSGSLGYMLNGWGNTDWNNLVLGYIYLPAMLSFSISSYLTTSLGVRCAEYFPNKVLKKIVGILCVLLSFKMLVQVLN